MSSIAIEDMMIYQLEEMKDVKKDVSMLKDTMRISGQQEFEIKQKGNMKVILNSDQNFENTFLLISS